MFKLKLPVLNNTDETNALQELNLDINYNDCSVGEIIFFNINAISDIVEDGRHWTEIFCNGRYFISPLTIDKVERLIDEQLKFSNYTL